MSQIPIHKRCDPAERAKELNDECVRMVERHEKPCVIHAVRDAFRREKDKAERYSGIVRVSVPDGQIPPYMRQVEDEVCRWHNLSLKQ